MEFGFVTRQLGPLPVWAWGGLTLGALLAVTTWQRNRKDSAAAAQNGGVTQQYKLPESLQPTYTFIDQDRTLITMPWTPPGGGRPPDPPGGGVTPTPPPPVATPPPVPSVTPPPPPPAGQWETVVKWSKGQAKGTPSTLWGIAEKWYGNGSTWGQIWAAPQNAAIRGKRGTPQKIQPGDRIWVPTK